VRHKRAAKFATYAGPVRDGTKWKGRVYVGIVELAGCNKRIRIPVPQF